MLAIVYVLIVLLAALALSGLVADRIRVPGPVLLVLIGLALAFVPGLPRKPLDPDLILVVLLPPLLYSDAFNTSWIDFRRWLRPILMLAIGLVGATILVVGVAAHALMPAVPWPACFVLGAVVSPTDTVAVQTILSKLRVPRRLTAVLGGESLLNDATGLVGVQIGVAVVLSGAFEASETVARFGWVAGGGVVVGVVVGGLASWLNRMVRQTPVLFALSLLSPYLAFLIAHHFGSSGVLAVVVAGFIVAWRIHYVPPEARIDLYATWELVVWVVNGLCFLFIGLETPRLIRETELREGPHLLVIGLLLAGVVVLVRMLWVLPAAYIPLLLSKRLREREGGLPSWKAVLLVGWCGMRGAISLAAALSLPAVLEDGREFPGRIEILACTLCILVATLIVQGLTLNPLIRALGIRGEDDSEAEIRAARERLLEAGVARLDAFCSETSCPISVHHWRTHMVDELAALLEQDEEKRAIARTSLSVSREVRRAVVEEQSRALLELRDKGVINDRTYLELQLDIDREMRVNEFARGGV